MFALGGWGLDGQWGLVFEYWVFRLGRGYVRCGIGEEVSRGSCPVPCARKVLIRKKNVGDKDLTGPTGSGRKSDLIPNPRRFPVRSRTRLLLFAFLFLSPQFYQLYLMALCFFFFIFWKEFKPYNLGSVGNVQNMGFNFKIYALTSSHSLGIYFNLHIANPTTTNLFYTPQQFK